MKQGIVLCCVSVLVITGASVAPALAENWKPIVGEADSFYDSDFVKVDESTGLVVARSATGGAVGKPYAAWGAKRSPIMRYALDCATDRYIFLGLDYSGAQALPKTWWTSAKEEGIGAGVGAMGKAVCAEKDSLPKANLH